ncbi:MAG TPA: hypothetical protein VMX97_11115 [Hyphomicrobiaceae bacterium]|nr:hypothetical protein [Hyphomicrobiaceae bacterium]
MDEKFTISIAFRSVGFELFSKNRNPTGTMIEGMFGSHFAPPIVNLWFGCLYRSKAFYVAHACFLADSALRPIIKYAFQPFHVVSGPRESDELVTA